MYSAILHSLQAAIKSCVYFLSALTVVNPWTYASPNQAYSTVHGIRHLHNGGLEDSDIDVCNN